MRRDVRFLRDKGLMDYSLLFAVEKIKPVKKFEIPGLADISEIKSPKAGERSGFMDMT